MMCAASVKKLSLLVIYLFGRVLAVTWIEVKFCLPYICNVTYSQFLEIRIWASLGNP